MLVVVMLVAVMLVAVMLVAVMLVAVMLVAVMLVAVMLVAVMLMVVICCVLVMVELLGERQAACANDVVFSSSQMAGATVTSTFVLVIDSSLIILCSDFSG